MFGRATIGLGIGPHSSYVHISYACCRYLYHLCRFCILQRVDALSALTVLAER